MTHASRTLLEQFDALSDSERSEIVTEMIRRAALTPHDLPQDDDLMAAADRIFQELDRREQAE